MVIGYLRGRAENIDGLALQRQALAETKCEQVVEDLTVRRRQEQPKLLRVLAGLQVDDVLVVPRMGTLGRSMTEVVRRVQYIAEAGAGLRSLEVGIDTTTEAGRAAVGVIGGLAQLGRSAVRKPPGAESEAVRIQGRKPGRKPKLTYQQRAFIVEKVLSGRETGAKMARHHKVSEATISRVMCAYRAKGDVPEGRRVPVGDTSQGQKLVGALPLSALDERLAIVGTSGSGKTYAAKGLVERLVEGGTRVCVVDPLGVWWGLRAGPEGGASPLPCPVVVFGGRHADVSLDEGMGAALGHLIGTHQIACVVDVSDLGSASARRGFMTAFTEALYQANTEPLHLVLDEADLWAPQRVQPDGYDLLQRVEEIVRRERIRDFVPWLISQRPAVLHKDVLSQADILVSMKLTSSQDREAVGRWIEGQADRAEGRRILAALPRLARGEGWVWAPSDGVLARVAFPQIRTLDSSQTPARPVSQGTRDGLSTVDLATIKAALNGTATDASYEHDALTLVGRGQVSGLEPCLIQRDAELADALARLALFEVRTETAVDPDP